MIQRHRLVGMALLLMPVTACAPAPTPTLIPTRAATPRPVVTPQVVVVADVPVTPSPRPTAEIERPPRVREVEKEVPLSTAPPPTATPTPSPTPTLPLPPSFLQQWITNLFDLSLLPGMENSIAAQFTSRNWVSLEHYFDYFIDDGNFTGPNYGYINEEGARLPYRIVIGYDGTPEYEIVPRVQGPGYIARIWFAYQQHQSANNPKDMSQLEEWNHWGNLGAMGNIRFYFDDKPTPRIDFGIKELFVGKNPFPAPLAAFYASANGGNVNYVPIPFQHSIRVTTTGRPRFMQVQVKRLASPPTATSSASTWRVNNPEERLFNALRAHRGNTVQSFTLNLTNDEQNALNRAAQAWQNCAPVLSGERKSFTLSIPPDSSGAVDFGLPATIAGLRVRVPREREESVWMLVFWDGETNPSLTAPLRALFGTAERLLPYAALPLGIIVDGTDLVFYNNFPMPFQSARFVFLNKSGEPLPLTFDVVVRETIPGTENARLHAFYGSRRMERREDDRDNYVVIDVQGVGKYLGTIFSAWDLNRDALNGPLSPNWRFPYLESNMDVWIDGRLALPGTGIEDDFNASYYYVYTGYPGYNSTYCLAGVTLLDYNSLTEPSSQYRFYLNDAPEFRSHLRVEAQHGNKGNNLTVTYSSTAFWYQMR